MKEKRGFTLIELLAIILILAIIVLIAIPTIMNIISEVNESAFKNSVYGIIKAGELYYSEKEMMFETIKNSIIFKFPNDIGTLQIKGSRSIKGQMRLSNDGSLSIAISNGKYCAKKGAMDIDVTLNEDSENCILPSIMISDSTCIKDNTICLNGTKVRIKVNDREEYDFNIIKDTGSELTLIMSENLGKKIEWINRSDYEEAGGINYGSNGNTEKGPLTALKALEDRTSKWINIPIYTYILKNDSNGNGMYNYPNITRTNVRARMLTYTEAKALGCTDTTNSCPGYLYTNTSGANTDELPFGYWLSTNDSTQNYHAYHIYYAGAMYASNSIKKENFTGLRPVITIPKNF